MENGSLHHFQIHIQKEPIPRSRRIPGSRSFFFRPTRPAGPPGPPGRSPHPRELCPRSRGPRPSEVGWSWCQPGRFLEHHPMVVTVEFNWSTGCNMM